jgi:hypothetical protein
MAAVACRRRGGGESGAAETAPSGFVQIAIGKSSACALLVDGTVQCWGDNSSGQVGDGSRENRLTPVPVPGLTGVVEVDVGEAHACARKRDGTVWCWGSGSSGANGAGDSQHRRTPSLVAGLPPVDDIGTSDGNTCAVARDGGVWCWGSNAFGESGAPPAPFGLPRPVRVVGLGPAAEVDTGQNHTCARLRDGTVWCWGYNGSGQLGDGTTRQRPTPAPVTGVAGARALAVGQGHACALLLGGRVTCWGYTGVAGPRVGNDLGLRGVSDLTAGNFSTCAVVGGIPHCFGQNYDGKLLAPRAQAAVATPTPLPGVAGVRSVALGIGYQCAIPLAGPVRCWGTLRSSFRVVLRTETLYAVTFDGRSPPPPHVDEPRARGGNLLGAIADAAAQVQVAAQGAADLVDAAANAVDDATPTPTPTPSRDPLAVRAARTTPLAATPQGVSLDGRDLTAERCVLGGPPILGENASGALPSMAFDGRGALVLVDGESHLRRYLPARGRDCRFDPDAAFGQQGVLTLPTPVTAVSVDRRGAIVASGVLGSYLLEDGAVTVRCNRPAHGYVTLSPRRGVGLGMFPGSPLRSVTYEDGACAVEAWTYEHPFRSVMALAYDRRDVIVGGSVEGSGNQIAIYDDRGRERARFGAARPTADDGFCWVHGVTACGPGYCVVDTNCDRLAVWSRRGEHVGNARASTLLGLRRPWLSAVVGGRRELFVAASQLREPAAERVAEGMIFRVRGL